MIAALVDAALRACVVSAVLGVVFFALVAVLVRTLSLEAAVRHLLWNVVLCLTAVVPLATLAVSAARSTYVDAPTGVRVGSTAGAIDVAPPGALLRARRATPARESAAGPTGRKLHALAAWQPRLDRGAALVFTGLWLGGALVGLTGLAASLVRVRGLKTRSSPLDPGLAAELPWLTDVTAAREIYVRLSYETETPVAVGFRRPVILIPTELATQGGLHAIEGLVLHEHAHLRRYDDWTNLVQRLIERIFWFNPLVWLLGRRIALEREIAADDVVVAELGQPHAYAQSLWQLAREMRMPEHAVVAPGALFTRKQISIRIEALLEKRPALTPWRQIAASAVALTALGCSVAAAATAPAIELARPLPATTAVPLAAANATATAPARAVSGAAEPAPKPLLATRPEAAAAVHPRLSAATRAIAQAWPMDSHSAAAADYTGRDLRGVDWRGRTFSGTNFSGADLRGARLDGARFIGADLEGAQLDGASLISVTMTGTTIDGASFRDAKTTGMRISGATLAGMDLHGLDLRRLLDACSACDAQGANLRSADLHGIHLTGTDFEGADLRGADLHGSVLSGANLDGAILSGANLRDTRLSECSLHGTVLHDADTRGAVFANVDMSGSE